MIANYSQPRDTIELIKQNVTPRTAFAARSITIGTQYLLSRYGQEDPSGIPYVWGGGSGDLDGNPVELEVTEEEITAALASRSDLVLDTATLKVYGEDLLFINGDFSTVSDPADAFLLDSLSTPNRLRHSHPTNNLVGGTLLAELQGRPVAVGDTILVDDNIGGNGYIERTVTGFLGRIVDRHVGSNTDKDNAAFASGAFNPPTTVASSAKISADFDDGTLLADVTLSGTFGSAGTARAAGALNAGDFAEVFTISFTAAPSAPGVVGVVVSSASGKFGPATFDSTADGSNNYVLSNAVFCGLTVTIDAACVPAPGDTVVIRAVGAYTNSGDWVTLDNTPDEFTGTTATTIMVRVTAGAELAASPHIFQVSDSAGTFVPFSVTRSTLAAGVNLGTVSGLELGVTTPSTVGLRTGDTFYIHAVPDISSLTEFDGLILNGPAADTTLFIDVADPLPVLQGFKKSGLIDSDWAASGDIYEIDEDDLTILLLQPLTFSNGASALATARSGFGTLYPSFRAAVQPGVDETAIIIHDVSELAQFGADDIDNELGKGVNNMFTGALGLEISALRVGSPVAADYAARLVKLQSDDAHYSQNALADDPAVREVARQHLELMSTKTRKRFRRGYVGINSPGRYAVLELQPDTTPYTATVTDYGGSNRLVTLSQDVDIEALNIRAGDEAYFPVSGVTSVISEIISATEFLLVTGLQAPLSPAVPVQLWKPNNARNTLDYVIEAAKAVNSDRVVLVWCEGGRRGTEAVPSQFIAAEIAGLRTAVLPQTGLSGVQLRTVTSATPMYARFTEDELNEVASHGVLIVAQDGPGAPCYIRHQLTTRTNNGILSWEDSCGYNHDMVGFTYKAVIAGFRGQSNRTETTRLRMESAIFQAAVDMSQAPVGQEAGAQITDFMDEFGVANKVTVRFDTVFADRFYVYVSNGLPVPVNGTDAKIRAHVQEIVA